MHELEANFGKWVIRYRWLIIVASLLIVVLAGSGGKHLAFTTNYRVFFSEESGAFFKGGAAFKGRDARFNRRQDLLCLCGAV